MSFGFSFNMISQKSIDLTGRGLFDVNGAAAVIKAITERRGATHLILGHNPLRDNGCETLFTWLCSPVGRKYQFQTLTLNVCHLGDRSLLVICQYLAMNPNLKELGLQANDFTGDPAVMANFAAGLNSSRVEVLCLSHSRPNVVTSLVANLDAPHLRELQCHMCSLVPDHASTLISYVASPRCRLQSLKANANSMGLRAVRELVEAIARGNFSLVSLDLYMNGSASDDTREDIEAKEATGKLLKELMTRNAVLKTAVATEAFTLLRYSRSLLIRAPQPAGSDSAIGLHQLPTELRLHVLSFFAPTLSPQQRIRVFEYASDPATLPQLLPTLGRPYFSGGPDQSIACRKGEDRDVWLALVGCDRYEHDFGPTERDGFISADDDEDDETHKR